MIEFAWPQVREHVYSRLLSSEFHCTTLAGLSTYPIAGDLVFGMYIDTSDQYPGMHPPITKMMTRSWHISYAELVRQVKLNDEKLAWHIHRCEDKITEKGLSDFQPSPTASSMYLIAYDNSPLSTTVVLREDVQEDLDLLFRESEGYYLLPASCSGWIALPAKGIDPENLAAIVYDINRRYLSESERLSDHVYTIRDGLLDLVI